MPVATPTQIDSNSALSVFQAQLYSHPVGAQCCKQNVSWELQIFNNASAAQIYLAGCLSGLVRLTGDTCLCVCISLLN